MLFGVKHEIPASLDSNERTAAHAGTARTSGRRPRAGRRRSTEGDGSVRRGRDPGGNPPTRPTGRRCRCCGNWTRSPTNRIRPNPDGRRGLEPAAGDGRASEGDDGGDFARPGVARMRRKQGGR